MIRDAPADALRDAVVAVGIDPPDTIHLERPGRKEHGDWSSNVAMATAKRAGRNPRGWPASWWRGLRRATGPC